MKIFKKVVLVVAIIGVFAFATNKVIHIDTFTKDASTNTTVTDPGSGGGPGGS